MTRLRRRELAGAAGAAVTLAALALGTPAPAAAQGERDRERRTAPEHGPATDALAVSRDSTAPGDRGRAEASRRARERAARARPAIGVWTALARDEPLKTRVGHMHDRDMYVLGVRLAWRVASSGPVGIDYVLDVLPVVVSAGMPQYASCAPGAPCGWTAGTGELLGSRAVYGFGVLPAGLQLRVAATSRVALVARGSAGVARFTRPVPDPDETRVNFWGDLGAGAEFELRPGLVAGVGFRLNHVSNANAGPVNPGMNSRMIELGLGVRR